MENNNDFQEGDFPPESTRFIVRVNPKVEFALDGTELLSDIEEMLFEAFFHIKVEVLSMALPHLDNPLDI